VAFDEALGVHHARSRFRDTSPGRGTIAVSDLVRTLLSIRLSSVIVRPHLVELPGRGQAPQIANLVNSAAPMRHGRSGFAERRGWAPFDGRRRS